jgi:hypothetical protein
MPRLLVALFARGVIFEKPAERCEPRGCIKVGLFSEAVQLLLDVLEPRLYEPTNLMAQEPCAGYYPCHEAQGRAQHDLHRGHHLT